MRSLAVGREANIPGGHRTKPADIYCCLVYLPAPGAVLGPNTIPFLAPLAMNLAFSLVAYVNFLALTWILVNVF